MNKFSDQFKKLKLPDDITIKISMKTILTLVFLVAAVLLFFGSTNSFKHFGSTPKKTAMADEITQIKATTDLPAQVQLYKQLIDRVGPAEAQDDLYHSGLPFTGQTHLLNHEVGTWLFQHDGVGGLAQCQEYFLASCYHGFVLDAIATGGMPEVAQVLDACKPQGGPTYAQCAHAVGHGFLAYLGYKNLTQALGKCDEIVSSVPDFPTFNCYDGVFMENIWALHDGGGPSPDRWVKPTDLEYPCDDSRINQKYLLGCWSNQPALIYQLSKGDLRPVVAECAKLTQTDIQQMCYNGLARQINPIAAGDLDQTFNLCGLLGGKWIDYCININDQAYFSVGDRSVPFTICSKIDASAKDECYQGLVGMINVYSKNADDHAQLCDKIDDTSWKQRCVSQPPIR